MVLRILFLICFISGCASTSRTKYEKLEKKHGYVDSNLDGGLKISSFKANAYTNKEDAELFAKFRAIEVCKLEGKKLAHILDVSDKTVSKDVLRTTGTGFPSYYYGMSPYYNRFNTGVSIGYSTSTSSTYAETYQLPHFEVIYECADRAFGPDIALREVSAEEMKLLVKDLKGGLQVEKIIAGSPNAKTIEVGDVIIRAGGERIDKSISLYKHFTGSKKNLPVEFLREGRRTKVNLRSHDVTSFIEEAQKQIIGTACTKKEIKEREICKT